ATAAGPRDNWRFARLPTRATTGDCLALTTLTPPAPLRIEFPESLPVSGRREEIMAAIAAHQVVIVCGETGSGKTTQLPKIALALGRGKLNAEPGKGRLIGHTQPRRI